MRTEERRAAKAVVRKIQQHEPQRKPTFPQPPSRSTTSSTTDKSCSSLDCCLTLSKPPSKGGKKKVVRHEEPSKAPQVVRSHALTNRIDKKRCMKINSYQQINKSNNNTSTTNSNKNITLPTISQPTTGTAFNEPPTETTRGADAVFSPLSVEALSSIGFLASFLLCRVVLGFTESINHEDTRKVTDHRLIMIKIGSRIPDAMIYDSAYNLKLFWNKIYRDIHFKEIPSSKILFHMLVAIDRFYQKNHGNSICKTITIQIAYRMEIFRYLSKFKLSLSRLAHPTPTIFSVILLPYQNLTDCFSLTTKYIPDKVKPLFLTYSIFETVQLYQKNVGVESLDMV